MADFHDNRIPGGPFAFPWVAESIGQMCPGMSLRDWFAGQIAGGMAAHSGTCGAAYGPSDIAARSYNVADAMVAAREPITDQQGDAVALLRQFRDFAYSGSDFYYPAGTLQKLDLILGERS